MRRRARVLRPSAAVTWLAFAAVIFAAGCAPSPLYRSGGQHDDIASPDSLGAAGEVSLPATEADLALFEAAKKWLGTPYRYGGTTRRGVDCSGLSVHLLEEVGVSLPRSVREQKVVGHEVELDALAPGDLVFFRLESPRVNHVGVALGGDRFVHASRTRGVRIDRLDDDYFRRRVVESRRVFQREETP